ncbi:hypothetical protein [Flavobacterium sp.]|uniref:hypothetical protein n=1 Tax=Flavobacterium sp. TaxID=239 RepID=UPI003F6A0E92
MKKIVVTAILLATTSFYAQVGIGTTNPEGALDVVSTNSGIVVPRVANTTAITTPINGMIIYDLSSNCFKSYQNDAWSDCGFVPVNPILVQVGNEGDDPNTVPSVVTATQLASVPGVTGVVPANETAYQDYIDANPNLFSAPATVAEVQAMINQVNANQTLLANIGTDADNGNNTLTAGTTAAQYNALPGVSGAVAANEAAYLAYIAANPNAFSSPATAAEVQAMIDAVNAPPIVAPTNPTGSASFTGKTCFDVATINDGGAFGPLAARQANKADFTATPTYTYTYSNTVASTNVSFVFVNTNGTPVVSISPTTVTPSVAANTNLTVDVTYASNLNTTAATLSAETGFTAELYVVYTTTAGTFQQKLTPNVRDAQCCGAFVSATNYKEFLCHNLGADTSLDPHVPVIGLQGAYIQWGRRGPNTTGDSRVDWQTAGNTSNFAAAPTSGNANAGAVSGWSTTDAANNAWRTAGGAKTANDPCPSGYRVPTRAEWTGVNNNNTASRTGTFSSNASNYGVALHYGPNASTKLLTLPAAGRRTNNDGSLVNRGSTGFYWSSTEFGINAYGVYIFNSNVDPAFSRNRTEGFSLRCIAE